MRAAWLLFVAACAAPAPASVKTIDVTPSATAAAEAPEPAVEPCDTARRAAQRAREQLPVMDASDIGLRRISHELDATARWLASKRLGSLDPWRDAYAIDLHRIAWALHVVTYVEGDARERMREEIAPLLEREEARAGDALRWCETRQGPPPTAERSLRRRQASELIPDDRDEAYRLHQVTLAWFVGWKALADDSASRLAQLLDHFEKGIARLERVRLSRHRVQAFHDTLIALIHHMISVTRDIDRSGEPRRSELHRVALADAALLNRLVEEIRRLAHGDPEPDDVPLIAKRCSDGDADDCYMLALSTVSSDTPKSRSMARDTCPRHVRSCVLANALDLTSSEPDIVKRALQALELHCGKRDGAACFLLAHELDSGEHTQQNRFRAQQLWLRVCSELGGENGCAKLNQVQYMEYARETWRQACDEHGTLSACKALGVE